jgi:hypothetical protein
VEAEVVVAMEGEVVRGMAVALAVASQDQDHRVLPVVAVMAVLAVLAQGLMAQAETVAVRTVDTVLAEPYLLRTSQ